MMTLTMTGPRYSVVQLRQIADELDQQIKRIDNVAQTAVIGGQPRTMNVWFDSSKLAAYGLTPESLAARLEATNTQSTPATITLPGEDAQFQVGSIFASTSDLGNSAVAVSNAHPVYLRDVARDKDGGSDVSNHVLSGLASDRSMPSKFRQ